MGPYTPEQQRYFAALGAFIAFWAVTEHALDRTIEDVIRIWPECPEAMLPKEFGRKVETLNAYIQERFKDFPDAVASLREGIDDLFEIGEARHWAAHGNGLLSIIRTEEAIRFARALRKRPGRDDHRKYTVPQLEKLANRSYAMARWLFALRVIVLRTIPERYFEKPFPEVRSKLPTPLPTV